jgi:hypothetical protein
VRLVHDLLDAWVLDKHDTPIGRVDGVRIAVRDGEPPRVTDVVLGGTVLAARVHPRLARLAAWVHRRVRGGEPTETRFPAAQLSSDGVKWKLDEVDARDTPALAWELWLREHVIARLPGGHSRVGEESQ